ncbi:metal-dependent hydrolase family protein [Treponema primitia]|uniref:metal-dependent hydrolase family protein n=1 Tax=Treponema primitia TaxID=88058 RepID=UPI00025558F5|nr:amidohydrolase family protein [Treponema primitia]
MKQLITNIQVFDGTHEPLIEHASIIIDNNIITEITQENVSRDQFDTVTDGRLSTAIPGLTDCHVHFSISKAPGQLDAMRIDETAIRAAKNAEATLYRGFTTVRDAGSLVFGLKKSIDEGYVDGPRIFPSHGIISQTSGHGDSRGSQAQGKTVFGHDSPTMKTGAFITADGVPEVLHAVREQLFLGASQIKIMAGGGIGSLYDPLESLQFTPEEMRAAVQAAADFGTYVFAHLYTPQQMQRAAEAGVQCFEHGTLLDKETAQIIKNKNIWLCPQFALFFDNFVSDVVTSPTQDRKRLLVQKAAYTQAEIINEFDLPTVFGTDLAMTKEWCDRYQPAEFRSKKKVHGSFKGLLTATGNVQELFKLCGYRNPYPDGKIGVLEAGSFADILLIKGNPAADLDLLSDINNIKMIMKDGKIYKNTL